MLEGLFQPPCGGSRSPGVLCTDDEMHYYCISPIGGRMGVIVNPLQHNKDVAEVKALVGLNPVISRHLSHHLRNAIAGAMCAIELGDREIAMVALEHAIQDLNEIGL